MKVFSRRIVLLVSLLIFLCAARGQELVLTLTVPSEAVTASHDLTVWLSALNLSSNEISWNVPSQLKCKLTSSQSSFDGLLVARSVETNSIIIAPGAFARREFVGTVPGEIVGQVIVELPGLNIGRGSIEVKAAPMLAPKPANHDLSFAEFIKEAEPLESGVGFDPGRFFKAHISGYEPIYFIAGTRSPNVKFQVGFAYQLLNNDGPLATHAPFLKGFNIAYTQTSLWDWSAPSATFFDTSYKPEFFYAWKNVTRAAPTNWYRLDLQGGLKHESNGKGGLDSRSLNIAYLRPQLTLGHSDHLQLSIQPRAWFYLGDRSDNPDIADFRGYVDLRTTLGWQRGLQLSALGRLGRDANRGSIQLDLTYPTMRLFGSFSLYLDVQYFNGYGESLLGYNQRSETLRVGLALFR